MKSDCCQAPPGEAGVSRYTGHGQCSTCHRIAVFPAVLHHVYPPREPERAYSTVPGLMFGLALATGFCTILGLPALPGWVAGILALTAAALVWAGYRRAGKP